MFILDNSDEKVKMNNCYTLYLLQSNYDFISCVDNEHCIKF